MQAFLIELVRPSVTDPREAARRVIGMGLNVNVLLMLLVLATVINTLIFFLSLAVVPPTGGMPGLFSSPISYAGVMLAGALAFALALTRVGAMLGGQGSFGDVLAITVWLQWLRVLAQALIFVAMVIAPAVALVLTMAVSLVGLWLFVTFLQAAHGFAGPMRALVTAGLSILALSFALTVLLMMTGLTPPQPI